ncbi:hypothetical protein SAMN02910289_00665 [Lachnospiraceae bacterium RM5]|nr:hypothetical protein SAMN02910289_00665 [Lachnospiraceae bacterium RM5]
MSKETGVEFAKVTIGNKACLICGDKNDAIIPDNVLNKIIKEVGQLDFHSHTYDNDCVSSNNDLKMMVKLRKETG